MDFKYVMKLHTFYSVILETSDHSFHIIVADQNYHRSYFVLITVELLDYAFLLLITSFIVKYFDHGLELMQFKHLLNNNLSFRL